MPADTAVPHAVPLQAERSVAERIAQVLSLLQERVVLRRRVLRAGEAVYRAGARFDSLHILHAGFFKIIDRAPDGREQVVRFHFKGDWLGFDGIADGQHGCDAIAMDTGEVWSVRYDLLLQACAEHPPLLTVLHEAMSREIARDRESLLSLCTLPADARVADFLRHWAEALGQRGLRSDQITLRMTRAEIGNYLGMTLETVSRALSRLAKAGLIGFTERGRRDICIPEVGALVAFVQRSFSSAPAEA
ncbi:Crp/Fnr family transcriptional regulator [Aquabacterium sp. J223]|uniref:Crp/Fnr family transcriptional regulator n=1 Tax=Aquabacterium sp. J223 TaxID=2898431 RepID=UPI0021AD6531|nr:helix-turn-helix domain-containing protein [Aquabacterium sp. J223]UUX97404.1 helix-turn-helix domain-containing protein [Aquabacterium sp. J223]